MARKVAKSDNLRQWVSHNKDKGRVNRKTGSSCGRKSQKMVRLNPPVDRSWRNAKLLGAEPQLSKKFIIAVELEGLRY